MNRYYGYNGYFTFQTLRAVDIKPYPYPYPCHFFMDTVDTLLLFNVSIPEILWIQQKR